MHIFIFKEFLHPYIFDGIDIPVRIAENYVEPFHEVQIVNIKLFYKPSEDIQPAIKKLQDMGCVLVDENPSLQIVHRDKGVKTVNTIYYNDRVILKYKSDIPPPAPFCPPNFYCRSIYN